MKHVTEFDDAVELIQPLYDLLTTGETPEGVTIGELPTFSAEQAFSLARTGPPCGYSVFVSASYASAKPWKRASARRATGS